MTPFQAFRKPDGSVMNWEEYCESAGLSGKSADWKSVYERDVSSEKTRPRFNYQKQLQAAHAFVTKLPQEVLENPQLLPNPIPGTSLSYLSHLAVKGWDKMLDSLVEPGFELKAIDTTIEANQATALENALQRNKPKTVIALRRLGAKPKYVELNMQTLKGNPTAYLALHASLEEPAVVDTVESKPKRTVLAERDPNTTAQTTLPVYRLQTQKEKGPQFPSASGPCALEADADRGILRSPRFGTNV